MLRTGSLFTQILSLFQRSDFARHTRELKAEYHARGFSCWDQFVAMMFCQLAQARSLREISDGLKCSEGRLKHLGWRRNPNAPLFPMPMRTGRGNSLSGFFMIFWSNAGP